MAATFYFVRHGETDWNAEARLQGQRDVPLNPTGRVQAEEAARRLRGCAASLAALDFVASPLVRARETMQRMRSCLGLDPDRYRTDPRLAELSFGRWEGLTWREVRACDPRGARARNRDKWGFRPPGGESYADLARRVAPALAALSGEVAIVAHGGVARVLLALRCGVAEEEAAVLDIWQGRVLVVRGDRYEWA